METVPQTVSIRVRHIRLHKKIPATKNYMELSGDDLRLPWIRHWLSVPVQVIDWKDSSKQPIYNVLVGMLNPTPPFTVKQSIFLQVKTAKLKCSKISVTLILLHFNFAVLTCRKKLLHFNFVHFSLTF